MIQTEQTIVCGFLGEQEVGKTCFINKYFRSLDLDSYTPTIAVQVSYSSHECEEGTLIRVKCWDTSGEGKYKGMVCYHLKECEIIVIMFDYTNLASFSKVDQWVNRLKSQNVFPKVLYLVGNKLDLVNIDSSMRKVTKKQAQNKANLINAKYAEISIKNEIGINFFDQAIEQVLVERAEKLIEWNKMKTNVEFPVGQIETHSVKAACQCNIF